MKQAKARQPIHNCSRANKSVANLSEILADETISLVDKSLSVAGQTINKVGKNKSEAGQSVSLAGQSVCLAGQTKDQIPKLNICKERMPHCPKYHLRS